MRKLHTRRKRRTAKQGGGKSTHRAKSGRTGSVHSKRLATRQPKEKSHE
jgi:hypothetical protein